MLGDDSSPVQVRVSTSLLLLQLLLQLLVDQPTTGALPCWEHTACRLAYYRGVGRRFTTLFTTTLFTTLFNTWGALLWRSRRFCWAPAWFYYRGRTADMLFTEGSALLTCFLLQGAHCSSAADDSVGHRHVHLHPPGLGGLVSAWRFS